MFSFFKKSLKNRLLSLFLIIGFLPFITLLTYTLLLSESKILDKTIIEQSSRTKVVISLINNHLTSIAKEVIFLSSLDLMDDILVEDMDKRISRLLKQKYNDLNLDIAFVAITNKSKIVSSSKKEDLLKKYNTKRLGTNNNGTYIKDKTLYFYSQINASFNKQKKLGYLILKYNLDNLNIYLTNDKTLQSYIKHPKNDFIIGKSTPLNIDFKNDSGTIINDKQVIVYENLSSFLNSWYIVYAVDKHIALEFFYDLTTLMFYISIIIFILIIFVSFSNSQNIVKPITDLTIVTDAITKTHNYSSKLEIHTQDEIATLTHSFNNMIQTTSSALQKLEEENKLRLKRFVQLIEVFNTIIQTKSEDECINISMQEIRKLTNKNNLHFFKKKKKDTNIEFRDLYVTDFKNNKKVYFGSIELEIDNFEDKNEKDFYDSICSMITHQLDKIRLMQKTTGASQAKSAFISNISHELRTPLNAIIGFAQYMIEYEDINKDQKDTIGNIESSAQYLLGMINEILDIAKIESGKMDTNLESCNILELVKSSHTMLSSLAKDKNIEFNLVYDNFKNINYTTDSKMFKQIVLNLISNAIKFTQKGTVLVELSSNDENIYVNITDSGIGIAKDDLRNLFNDFTQVENIMQKSHKGTGLGLSLSKKMAMILGGDVTLESKGVGYGSKSQFWLKIR